MSKGHLPMCQVVNVDPWNMLINFCFHVYADISLIVGEIDNVFFTSLPYPVTLPIIELVPKITRNNGRIGDPVLVTRNSDDSSRKMTTLQHNAKMSPYKCCLMSITLWNFPK